MVDHFQKLGSWDAPIYRNSIPVLFVHVIAGPNRLILLTPLDRLFRIAFKVQGERPVIDAGQEEDLSIDSEDEHFLTKRKVFGHLARFGKTIRTDTFEIQSDAGQNNERM
jgi:hypothetical protein